MAFASAPVSQLPESGSWAAVAAAAARKGTPVVVFANGFPGGRLPVLGEGGWARAGGGVWVDGWKWVAG